MIGDKQESEIAKLLRRDYLAKYLKRLNPVIPMEDLKDIVMLAIRQVIQSENIYKSASNAVVSTAKRRVLDYYRKQRCLTIEDEAIRADVDAKVNLDYEATEARIRSVYERLEELQPYVDKLTPRQRAGLLVWLTRAPKDQWVDMYNRMMPTSKITCATSVKVAASCAVRSLRKEILKDEERRTSRT